MLPLRSMLVASLIAFSFAPDFVHAQPTTPIYFAATSGTELAGVVAAPDGGAYLTFTEGGANGLGTVTRRGPDGAVTVVHAFSGADGARPEVPLRFGPDGALYGTTSQGGRYGNGTAFRITPGGELSTLHDFSVDDGGQARVPLLVEADGGVYGVTSGNYRSDCDAANSVNCASTGTTRGKVFALDADATFHVLYAGIDRPGGGLMRASTGVLYGTMRAPYSEGPAGAVFRLSDSGRLSVSSPRTSPPFDPFGELFEASDGYIYGSRTGAMFRMSLEFEPRAVDYHDVRIDDGPFVPATFGIDGNQYFVGNSAVLYRATRSGVISRLSMLDLELGRITSGLAANAAGFLLGRDEYLVQLSLTGAARVLHHFGFEAGYRLDALTLTSQNELYGTTLSGAESHQGALFRVDARGELTTLHSFTDSQRFLSRVRCGFVEASDGALYAVTDAEAPALIRVRMRPSDAPPRAATFESLHVFPAYAAYDPPRSASECLFAGDDGMLYGNMEIEPRDPAGRIAIYRFDPSSGALRILARVSFLTHMLRTKAGAFYGTRYSASGDAQFFEVKADGSLNVLHNFPASESHYPSALAEGSDGSIYLYASGPLNTGDSANTTDIIYRWTAAGSLEGYYTLERPQALWLDAIRLVVSATSEVYVSAAVRVPGDQFAGGLMNYVIFPDKTTRDFPRSVSGFLPGADGRIYQAVALTRTGYEGFQLAPVD